MHVLTRAALLLGILVLPAMAGSQTITGTITGIVKDSSGGVLPGATITMTQAETGRHETVVSDTEGRYTSRPLPLGTYRVEASLSGFKGSAKAGIALTIDEVARVDLTLDVGAVAEVVEVAAQASLVDARTSSVGKLVDNRRIAELPLNTRNMYSLIFLTPGRRRNHRQRLRRSALHDQRRAAPQQRHAHRRIDRNVPDGDGGAGISVFPSVDAIQEFKVIGANYPAEFGRSLGGVVNVVYKSGQQQFHGSGFEFLRDSSLDRQGLFPKARGEKLGDFSRHQFGGSAGGPIQAGRHSSWSRTRACVRTVSRRRRSACRPIERQGDFSQTFAANGQLVRIFNPFSTRPNPAGGFIRDQFAGNRIPPGCGIRSR